MVIFNGIILAIYATIMLVTLVQMLKEDEDFADVLSSILASAFLAYIFYLAGIGAGFYGN